MDSVAPNDAGAISHGAAVNRRESSNLHKTWFHVRKRADNANQSRGNGKPRWSMAADVLECALAHPWGQGPLRSPLAYHVVESGASAPPEAPPTPLIAWRRKELGAVALSPHPHPGRKDPQAAVTRFKQAADKHDATDKPDAEVWRRFPHTDG